MRRIQTTAQANDCRLTQHSRCFPELPFRPYHERNTSRRQDTQNRCCVRTGFTPREPSLIYSTPILPIRESRQCRTDSLWKTISDHIDGMPLPVPSRSHRRHRYSAQFPRERWYLSKIGAHAAVQSTRLHARKSMLCGVWQDGRMAGWRDQRFFVPIRTYATRFDMTVSGSTHATAPQETAAGLKNSPLFRVFTVE